MADLNPTDRGASNLAYPAAQDAKTEHAVLSMVLHEHPTRLTMSELARVFGAYPDLGGPDDAIQEAVYQLVGAGLIHRDGPFLAPTRAALYFARLEED
jgi:hypothetical protein